MRAEVKSISLQDIQQPAKRRNANYKLLEALKDFEQAPREASHGTYGNISMDLYPAYTKNFKKTVTGAFYDNVSAPMLLARLVSGGFTPYVEGQDGYKVTFTFVLKHKPTGCIVTFYDYKGAASFGACEKGHEDKKFQAAVKKLAKALTDSRFPHPYDGCVVGEIA